MVSLAMSQQASMVDAWVATQGQQMQPISHLLGPHRVLGRKNSGISSLTSAAWEVTPVHESPTEQNMRSGASNRPFCSLRRCKKLPG